MGVWYENTSLSPPLGYTISLYLVCIFHAFLSPSFLIDVGWLSRLKCAKRSLNVCPLRWRISTIFICSCDSALFGTSPTAHGPNGTGARNEGKRSLGATGLGWNEDQSHRNFRDDPLHHLLVGAAPADKHPRKSLNEPIFIISTTKYWCITYASAPVPPKSPRTLQRHSRPGGVTSEALRGQPQFVAAQLSLNMFEPLCRGTLNMKCCERVGYSGCKCFQMPFFTFWLSN